MKEEIVTNEVYRGYEIQVREEWHLTRRELTGYGICHDGDINLQTPGTRISLLASAEEVYEAVSRILESLRESIDVVYEGDPSAVLAEMESGNVTRIWSANNLEADGEKLSQVGNP